MIVATIEIFTSSGSVLRIQAQSQDPIVIDSKSFDYHPVGLGLPHEVSSLSASLRDLTLRSRTPSLDSSIAIGELAALNNGLIGATVESRTYNSIDLINPTAIYREQVLRSRLNDVDLILVLSTESQPLRFWTD